MKPFFEIVRNSSFVHFQKQQICPKLDENQSHPSPSIVVDYSAKSKDFLLFGSHLRDSKEFFPMLAYVNLKGWLAITTLKPTFTFLGRNFAIFNTFTWQNLYQEK